MAVIRAPLAPSGCPRAIAPPDTLTRAGSRPSSRMQGMACAANASFNSTRSRSATESPRRASSFLVAGTGPSPMQLGSTPATAVPTMRASGVSRCALTAAALATPSAAAPSLMPLELPAVAVPSLANAGVSFARLSIVASGRGCSSVVTGAFTPGPVTGTSSASK